MKLSPDSRPELGADEHSLIDERKHHTEQRASPATADGMIAGLVNVTRADSLSTVMI